MALDAPSPLCIGRAKDIAALLAVLTQPQTQLITLTGPGGVGKTRLAVEAARQARDLLGLSVTFADLQPVRSVELLPAAIAEAAGLTLQGLGRPHDQLVQALGQQRRLLVLDSMEHLLQGADLVTRLLAAIPALTVLVTSRELLGIDEQVLLVEPLPLPEPGSVLTDNPAIQLFMERAQRSTPRFEVERELPAVVDICRLVGGLPLALELAAAWTGTLSCAQIAGEIRRALDVLSTNRRDVPERHRSITAVFESSWQALRDTERATLARLAVFFGAFHYLTAELVVRASLPVLRSLAEKSLIRARGDGWYDLHELVRQFAEARLTERGELTHMRERHAEWVLDLLAAAMPGLGGPEQATELERLETNLDNIRAAWRFAIEERMLGGHAAAVQTAALFYRMTCRFVEGAAACHAAVTSLEGEDDDSGRLEALATALTQAGWFDMHLGNGVQCFRAFRRAAELIKDHELAHLDSQESDPLLGLAYCEYGRGDMQRSEELARDVLTRAISSKRRANQYAALSLLGRLARYDRRTDQARADHTRAHALATEAGDAWYRAKTLYELGMTALDARNLDEARRFFEAGEAVLHDPYNRAVMQNGLGTTDLTEGKLMEAEQRFTAMLDIFRRFQDELGVADGLHGLGRAVVRQGRLGEGVRYLSEGLRLAYASGVEPLTVTLLVDCAELLMRGGREVRAAELLGLAQTRLTWSSRRHYDVERGLGTAIRNLSPEALAAALERGRMLNIDQAVADTLAELVTLEGGGEAAASPPPPPPAGAVDIPPLTMAAEGEQTVVRVLIVDAHAIMRRGLVQMLTENGRIAVVGEAGSGRRALELASELQPDLVLLDFVLPDIDGVTVARRLLAADAKTNVLMLTSISDERWVREAIEAGVIGYLLKDISKDELVEGVLNAAGGRPALHPTVQRLLLHYVTPAAPPAPSPLGALSERDQRILRLLAQGASNRAIAQAMGFTHGTVKVYVSGLLTKLGVADRTQAALLAARHGLE